MANRASGAVPITDSDLDNGYDESQFYQIEWYKIKLEWGLNLE